MNKQHLSDFLDIIRKINNGTVIPNLCDSETQIPLDNKEIRLFKQSLSNGSKYFFFANLGDAHNLDEAIAKIENTIIPLVDHLCGDDHPKPSDSYLICFWKVLEIDESINKQVINLEENEYYFKKYVFYYTEREYNEFSKWYSKILEDRSVIAQVGDYFIKEKGSPQMKFFTRLIIKVPCIKTYFSAQALPSFDQLVCRYLNKIQLSNIKNSAVAMNNTLMQAFDQGRSADDVVSIIESLIQNGNEV